MDKENLRKEYTEVLEILKHMDQEEYEKIPTEEIENLNRYKDDSYKFIYDDNKSFEEQDISKEAFIVLLLLYYDYILNEKEKGILLDILKLNELKSEKEKEINYALKNQDIFSKVEESESKGTSLIEVKEDNLVTKILKFIKRIFVKK